MLPDHFCKALIALFVIVCFFWFFYVRENMLPVAIQLPRKDNIFGNPWQNLRLPSQD
jgi:hypothetical protein